MSHLFRSAIVLALFAIAAPIALYGDPLPPAFANYNFIVTEDGVPGPGGSGSIPITHPGVPINLSGNYGPQGHPFVWFTADYGTTTDPSIVTKLQVNLNGNLGGATYQQTFDNRSDLAYFFEVNGPASQTVSVNIAGSGNAQVSSPLANFGADSVLTVYQGNGSSLLSAFACAGDTASLNAQLCADHPGSPATFSVNGPISVQTDTPYMVLISGEDYFSSVITGESNPLGTISAQSLVDPTITLDTTDPNYSLSFSPGLKPGASTVPEPGTLALTLSGIAALALASLRRRSCNSCAP